MTTAIIARTRVDSMSLASLGYSRDHHILEVEFRNGGIYRFFMVPIEVYDELLAAPSKGAHFNRAIRNRFPCTRLALPP